MGRLRVALGLSALFICAAIGFGNATCLSVGLWHDCYAFDTCIFGLLAVLSLIAALAFAEDDV